MPIVKKANPKASHKELMSIISQLYNKLSEDKKKPYADKYEKEKKEYQVLLDAYEKKNGKIPKKEKVSGKGKGNSKEVKEIKRQIMELGLPEKPKKGLTAFFCFRQDLIEKVKKDYPDKSYIELASVLGEKWGKMSEADKKKYEEKSKKLSESYAKEIKDYNNKNEGKLA